MHATKINRNMNLSRVRVSDAECAPCVTQRSNCNGQEIISAHKLQLGNHTHCEYHINAQQKLSFSMDTWKVIELVIFGHTSNNVSVLL